VLSLLALGAFLFYAAFQALPNNWHGFLLGGPSQVWADFFPLAPLVIKWLNPNPVYANGFSGLLPLHLVSATAAFMAFALFFSLPALRRQPYYSFIALLAFIGQLNSLWLMSFSLGISLSLLGLALIIKSFTLSNATTTRPILVPVCAFAGYVALLGASPLALPLVVAGIVFGLLRRQFMAFVLPIVLAMVACLLIWPSYIDQLLDYYTQMAQLPMAHRGAMVPGASLPFYYGFAAFIRSANPLVWALPLAALPYAVRNKKTIRKNPLFLGALAVTGVLALLPEAAGKSAHFLMPLSLPLLYIGVLGIHKTALIRNKRSGIWVLLLASVLLSYPGWWGLARLSPYQYLVPGAPFASLPKQFSQHSGDYLNMAGNTLLLKEISTLHPTDTLATNFDFGAMKSPLRARQVRPYNNTRIKYTRAVLTRAVLTPAVNASAAFPPPQVMATESYAGISLAVSTKPIKKVRQAFQLLDSIKYGEAVTRFKELTAKYPSSPEAYYGLAKSKFLFNLWDEAMQAAQVGLSLFPASLEFQVLQGEVYRKQNRNAEATGIWRKVLKQDPQHQRTLWLMAEYCYRSDSMAQAERYAAAASTVRGHMGDRIQKFQQLLKERATDPRFAEGVERYFIKQINTFRTIGQDSTRERLRTIRQSIKQYIDLDSTNAPLRSHLGITFMMSEHFPQAALAFDKAIETNPNYPQMREYLAIARMNWAAMSLEHDSAEAAIFHYQIALDYQPNNPDIKTHIALAYNRMAEKYMNANDLNTAYGNLRAALSYDPNHAASYLTMGRLQLAINQEDSAEIAFVRAYQLDKRNQACIEALIDFYGKRGDAYKVKVYAARLQEAKRKRK
jgi:tetratricopeptide (TPR) repeat protein